VEIKYNNSQSITFALNKCKDNTNPALLILNPTSPYNFPDNRIATNINNIQ
jgi:hypothetical protein